MEDYILKDEEKERKKKQDYLINNVIKKDLDPEAFAVFLESERLNGASIDSWTQEELETMVGLFRRSCQLNSPELELKYKLETIELDEDEANIYVKRLPAQARPRTLTSKNETFVQVSNSEVVDSGLFYGRSVFFHIELLPQGTKLRRTESEFKWLAESLTKEFPTIAVPPLVKIVDTKYSPEALKAARKFFEKFLNDCLRHPELRTSVALDAFFSCQSKEELTNRQKEIAAYYKAKVPLEKNISKKAFDYSTVDYLKNLPSTNGQITLKLSQSLRQHFVCAEGQYVGYDQVFEKIEKINIDVEKAYKRLLSANQSLKEAFGELQTLSIKANSGKLLRTKSSLIEDSVFASISRYFENHSGLTSDHPDIRQDHLQRQHRRLF
jgi:hypothetical protein